MTEPKEKQIYHYQAKRRNRQYHDQIQKINNKKAKNTTQKTKDWATDTPPGGMNVTECFFFLHQYL